jgi:glycosyltransferase involved in cell wall biosynthesis
MNSVKPLVSILIPAYKAAEWLTYSLESAIAQTWPRKEIIVVDDGSPDDTLAVARRYESSMVKVVTQRNQGAAAARNTAFSLSSGDYIQWLDADDLIVPEKVASQLAALSGCSKRIVASGPWAAFLYRSRRADFVPTALWCDLSPLEWLLRKMELNLHMQTATWLVSREVTAAAGPWNTQLLGDDDGEYFCRVLLQSERVKFVPEARVLYRDSGATSLSYIGRSNKKIEAQFYSMQLNIDYIRSLEDSPRVRAACVTYLQSWLMNFYPERPDIVKRFEELAVELGGRLGVPEFSWKYAWLERVGGPDLAKRAQVVARNTRWSVARSFDKMLLRAENAFAGSASKSGTT